MTEFYEAVQRTAEGFDAKARAWEEKRDAFEWTEENVCPYTHATAVARSFREAASVLHDMLQEEYERV